MASIQTRKWSDGTIGHTFRVRIKGRQYNQTFDCTAEKGRCKNAGCTGGQAGAKWAAEMERSIQLGTAIASSKHSFKELVEYHVKVELHKTRKSELNRTKLKLKFAWWQSHLEQFKLSDITTDIIAELKSSLATGKNSPSGKPLSGSTLNRYHDAFSQLWKTAKKLRWVSHNPLAEIELDEENDGRERALDAEEQKRLLAAARESRTEKLYLWVLAGLATGARCSELVKLTWRHVNLELGRITLVGTKNGTTRIIAIHPTLLVAFQELKARPVVATEVFGKFPRLAYENAVRRAKFDDVVFHTLRHTCATDLATQGFTANQLMNFMGWKTITMAQRYCHPNEAATLELADKVASRKF